MSFQEVFWFFAPIICATVGAVLLACLSIGRDER